jgi:TetR/AcrR family transcriptional regulator, tetracycline repressor protein
VSAVTERRAVGQRAGIDLARIIEAARSLDTDSLTVQAVATKLGVDRKAIRHHVSDRETLLKFVAIGEFSDRLSALDIPADSSWQEGCRIFGMAVVDSTIAADTLAPYLTLDSLLLAKAAVAIERILTKLEDAGFDDEAAVRTLSLLTNICMAHGRDVILLKQLGERPRQIQLRLAFGGVDPQEFEHLARMVASPPDTYNRKQLDLSIEVFLRGIEAVFPRHR